MQYVQLGETDMQVSRVSFGAIPIRRLSFEEAERVIIASIDSGINFLDTARGYGDSEEKLGRALRGRRDEVFLATKSARRSADELNAELNTSLSKLRTDYIDLYQLHNVSSDEDYEEVFAPGGALEALKKAQRSGKVRYIGITSHDVQMSLRAIDSGEFSSIMVPFNFMESEFGEEVLPAAVEAGMGTIIMKPFAGGILHEASLALRYVLTFSEKAVTIPGMGAVEEVQENVELAAVAKPLTAEERKRLERQRAELGTEFCRACDYCQPCPNDVSISRILRSESGLRRLGQAWLGDNFSELEKDVDRCDQCETCVPRCPYDLDIPRLLREKVESLRDHL